MSNISFSGTNRGSQIGINHGWIYSSFNTYNQNTQGGPIFNGKISAGRDLYINNIINKAYHLFQSSLDAPSLFSQVQRDLGILNSLLTLTRQRFGECDPGEIEYQTLNAVLRSCDDAFTDLSQIQERFDNVDPEAQVKFERFGIGVEEIQDIRARITSNIQALNLLISEMTRSSQTNVERLLSKFIGEIRAGKRDVSRSSQASLTKDEAEAWRLIRKDLQSMGLTPDALQKNHAFIIATLRDSLPVFGIAIPEDTEVLDSLSDEFALPYEPQQTSIAFKRATSFNEHADEGVQRSMARRKKNAPPWAINQKCPHCHKVFKRLCDLTKHEKTHSRPWKCSEPSCKYFRLGWSTKKERDCHVNDKHSKNLILDLSGSSVQGPSELLRP